MNKYQGHKLGLACQLVDNLLTHLFLSMCAPWLVTFPQFPCLLRVGEVNLPTPLSELLSLYWDPRLLSPALAKRPSAF